MKKQELINRLKMLDIVADQVSRESLPQKSEPVCASPISVMYRMRDRIKSLEQERILEFCDVKNENTRLRDRIKELEVEKEGIQTAQSAMAEAMESTRKRMHRMQQIVGNLTNVRDQEAPLASGATSCDSKNRDRSPEGTGLCCIALLAFISWETWVTVSLAWLAIIMCWVFVIRYWWLHLLKHNPRKNSKDNIWSIGLLAIISDAWKAVTIKKRIWDGNTGEEIPIYSVCVRIIGPFGILTHGVIEYGNLSWKIGRIAWLNPRAYSAYLQCLPPSVVRQIVEKILLWPLSRNSDPCQLAVGQPERGYESPQVGLPHSDVNETEDERKNRLSAPRIADAKSRLCPDEGVKMNLHSKKSIPRAGSPEGTAIWSIGLLGFFPIASSKPRPDLIVVTGLIICLILEIGLLVSMIKFLVNEYRGKNRKNNCKNNKPNGHQK